MMTFATLLQVTFGLGSNPVVTTDLILFGFFKILFVVAAALYVAFSFVVTRQIRVMKNTLITPISPIITTIGYVQLALSVVVFLFFLLVL